MQTKAKTIHIKKAFGGLKTARDVWREQVLGGRLCTHCQTSHAIGLAERS